MAVASVASTKDATTRLNRVAFVNCTVAVVVVQFRTARRVLRGVACAVLTVEAAVAWWKVATRLTVVPATA